MTVDPTVIPGLLILVAEFSALAAVGYVISRAALQQENKSIAMAQGLVVGIAIWGLIVNFTLAIAPGLSGAAVGWVLFVAMGVGLAMRRPHVVRVRPRAAMAFAAVSLVLCWVALATRQLGSIPDPLIQLGLAASIRAGGFPPELPWGPGMQVSYHYGPSLLVGLLAPPAGPDLAFTFELLGVYAWTGLALLVLTVLVQRGSWPVRPGAWPATSLVRPLDIRQRRRGDSSAPGAIGSTRSRPTCVACRSLLASKSNFRRPHGFRNPCQIFRSRPSRLATPWLSSCCNTLRSTNAGLGPGL